MNYADRWLLPDGVEEILPSQAMAVENTRRRLLNVFTTWGYELVIPPMVEFTESLLIGVGNDLDLLTLKVTDQLSGRTMGIRSDITPQIARMDAHSFSRPSNSRLCYAGHVVHAKPKTPLATRTPIQVGVELFGEAGLEADIEVICLLLESLVVTEVSEPTLDLGHVGIYRALAEVAGLSKAQEAAFFELLQIKAMSDIQAWVAANVDDGDIARWLLALPSLSGDASILAKAQEQLADAPAEVLAAIDELSAVAALIAERYPQVNAYYDLSELRGYHYHTGIVFAAFSDGFGDSIANGGRYDHIGEVFGRARAATGFAINLTALMPQLPHFEKTKGIYAPASEDSQQWQAIRLLREQGETVVCGLSLLPPEKDIPCDRQLVLDNGQYHVKPFDYASAD